MTTKSTKRHKRKQGAKFEVSASSARRCIVLLFVSFCAFSWPSCIPAQPFTFDDIEFWVGSGANRAALVIDWVEDTTEPPALVWGYRWDGAANGRDMLQADRRRRSTACSPSSAATPNTAPRRLRPRLRRRRRRRVRQSTMARRSTTAGIAFVTGPADGTTSIDSDDYYAEGWARASGTTASGVRGTIRSMAAPGQTATSAWHARSLVDGAWDSLGFRNLDVQYHPLTHMPANPIAALPPLPTARRLQPRRPRRRRPTIHVGGARSVALSQLDADGNAERQSWTPPTTSCGETTSPQVRANYVGSLRTPPVPEPATVELTRFANCNVPDSPGSSKGEALMNSSASVGRLPSAVCAAL